MSRGERLILGQSLRQHMGGRWAISWIVIALSAPLGFIAGLNNMADATDATSDGWWIVVSLIGVGVVVALLVLAHFTLFRNRSLRAVPMWWVVALGAFAGASRSAITTWIADAWGLLYVDGTYVAIRTTTGALLGATLLPLAAVLASVISNYLTQRRELELELRDLEVERMRQSGRSEALREALVMQVEAELTQSATTVDADEARQVSRRLWESVSEPVHTSVPWRHVVRVTLTCNPYPTLLVVVLWTIAAWGSLLLSVGFTRALAQMAVSIAGIAASFALGRRLTISLPKSAFAVLIAVVVFLIGWTGVVAPLLVGVDPADLNAGSLVATAVWIPVLVITSGIVISAVRSGDSVVNQLREAVGDQQVAMAAERAETARIQQELATILHGSVQSRLLAAAAIIRQPGPLMGDERDAREALQGVLSVMHRKLDEERSLADDVAETVGAWIPLMQVTVIGSDTKVQPATQSAIVQVIEEGLSNAYRHGGASKVRVVVEPEGNCAWIRIEDNGSGVPTHSSPGLGSALLDSLAPGAWSLRRTADGWTVLQVPVPPDS